MVTDLNFAYPDEPERTVLRNVNLRVDAGAVVGIFGQTGSGKSTTLYAGLNAINNGDRNILTVEDPIEYEIAGISQTQVNTFDSKKAFFVRHPLHYFV